MQQDIAMADRTAEHGAIPIGRRSIVTRTKGRRHGPITRLISPGELGAKLKPFVFLDFFEMTASAGGGFAPHPHSGIATLTTFLEGSASYSDSTGEHGTLTDGCVEWMRAGSGVWHGGSPLPGRAMRGYQLWLSLPQHLELTPAESLYLEPDKVPTAGPARVLLGSYDGATSPVPPPASITYLHVRLRDGERWTYHPAADHQLAWLALNTGRLHTAGVVLERELAVFADGADAIELVAEGEVELVIGSAAKHPHPLVTGHYSVHTSEAALAEGERTIAALGRTEAVAALH